jgi:hypothetical protein
VEGSSEHGKEPSDSKKMLANSSVAAQLVAFQEGLSTMESVIVSVLASLFLKSVLHIPPIAATFA